MITIAGASGQLGHLVIDELLKTVPARQIIALARDTKKAADLTVRGVQVRAADYDRPETLGPALAGTEQLLLISASEVGKRAPQHQAVIAAAKQAGVKHLVYTSLLHAEASPLPLKVEHWDTEQMIAASGIPATILRNGWYTENYLASVAPALQYGVLMGSASEGRIASAARADYAAAAAAVLTRPEAQGKVYELAGDTAYTLTEFAAAIAASSGKAVAYKDLPEADFRAALIGAQLPEWLATLLAESDVGASKGGLFDGSQQLSRLIGRPTTPWQTMVKQAVA